ncbi:TetR/AcrR family transcriptional regulator [Streptosporangium sp. CA-135522]|uniref:TetR/AcrR family transcriptional regulator n=1 Tax=Streptosporangium sp. CA-135522 TaxID=3240072 RepID=UPI003D94508C
MTRSTDGNGAAPAPRRRMSPQARREVIERAATEVFAERGYHAASVEEIAKRSGISVPVLYDHFASKQELHRHLLARHYAELRAIWHEHLSGDERPEQRVFRTVDAWFAYVETHPYAWSMLFADTTGQDEAEAIRREVAQESRAMILPLFARVRGADADEMDDETLDLAWEAWRAAIQGMALWWRGHRHVRRERLVAMAMNTLWIGLERVRRGESWSL